MTSAATDGAYGSRFSRHYDVLTGLKDYPAEIDALDAFVRSSGRSVHRILEVGCGTGRHARGLQERGFALTALDISGDIIAVAKATPSEVRFRAENVSAHEEHDYDFGLSLFNVVNCILSLDQLGRFFGDVHARLRDGAGFLFECWNAVAVIASPPTIVERRFVGDGRTFVRLVTPQCDFFRQRLRLTYDVSITDGDDDLSEPAERFQSVHDLMLFTPAELRFLLECAGFAEIEFRTALPDLAVAGPDDRMLAVSCRKPGPAV